jgi:UDP-N-acetylmuramate--alanine ligase
MSGLAQMLVERGLVVSGPRPKHGPLADRLRKAGVRIHTGHAPRGLTGDRQVVLYGPDVDRTHPARLRAARRGIVQATAGQWLGLLMRKTVGLAVAGQRDAAIASAMIGWTLTRAGLDPTVVVGSPVPQLGGWARVGSGPHFVAEAIEEPGELGPLFPQLAVLLNVAARTEADRESGHARLRRFAMSVPADGLVLALEGNALVADAVRDIAAAVERISLERGSAWWGGDLREERGRYRFRAFHRGRFAVEVRLQVPGRRNVLSALAAVAACDRLALPVPAIKEGLEEFTGLSGDFESRGSYRGVTLVDDEGQGPSSVSETLAIAREVFGSRRLWVVYLVDSERFPLASPDAYRAAFAAADHVLVPEGHLEGASRQGVRTLVRALVAAGSRASLTAGFDDTIEELDRTLEPGDVLVTLGAGEVGTIADAFIRRLSRDRQGR